MSNAPKFDLCGANIGNLAETVQGDQIAYLLEILSLMGQHKISIFPEQTPEAIAH